MLEDLRDPDVRTRLAAIWTDPKSLDPSTQSARVTREVADLLATISRRLEARGHSAEAVSSFLMRLLFTMFAEDTEVLLPKDSFKRLLSALAGLDRYVATTQTAKHRTFQFVERKTVIDQQVIGFATDDAYVLGCLSSTPHMAYALAASGRLGGGAPPRYNNKLRFAPFPFPFPVDVPEPLKAHPRRGGGARCASESRARRAYRPDADQALQRA